MSGRRLHPAWRMMAAAALALALALGLGARAAETVKPADDPRTTTEQAQTAYDNGRYDEAVKLYEKLAERSPGDPALLYNLGNAYAHTNQRGMAIWRYLQALRLEPRDRDLRFNLERLAPDISQQLAIAPIPPINWIYQLFTANEWTAMAGTAAILAMTLGALYFFRLYRTRLANPARTLILALLAFAAVAYPFAFTHYNYDDDAWRGVVVEENTVAHAGPSLNQTETDRLPVGTVLRILEKTQAGWIKFSYAGGRMGFVEQNRVRSL